METHVLVVLLEFSSLYVLNGKNCPCWFELSNRKIQNYYILIIILYKFAYCFVSLYSKLFCYELMLLLLLYDNNNSNNMFHSDSLTCWHKVFSYKITLLYMY